MTILALIVMSIQLAVPINNACVSLARGGERDSGIFPRRSRNLNTWYAPKQQDITPGAQAGWLDKAYPITYQVPDGQASTVTPDNGRAIGDPRRIVLVNVTACPVFRAQDGGSTNPPLIA